MMSIDMAWVNNAVHTMAETRVEKEATREIKELLSESVAICRQEFAPLEMQFKHHVSKKNALEKIWIGIFGPPKELIVDGEGGIALSESTRARLNRYGTKLHIRAKDQHARYAERRGALLRDAIHRIHSQLREEGITLPFSSVLSEATSAGMRS